jgi:hypothetical protein
MNEVNDETSECESHNAVMTEPNDENPGSFFRIPSPPRLNDAWSLS